MPPIDGVLSPDEIEKAIAKERDQGAHDREDVRRQETVTGRNRCKSTHGK